jgi:hypothetical protein
MKDYIRNKGMPQATTTESALPKMIQAKGRAASTEHGQKYFRNSSSRHTGPMEQGIKGNLWREYWANDAERG